MIATWNWRLLPSKHLNWIFKVIEKALPVETVAKQAVDAVAISYSYMLLKFFVIGAILEHPKYRY
jgi:hypothetical protein